MVTWNTRNNERKSETTFSQAFFHHVTSEARESRKTKKITMYDFFHKEDEEKEIRGNYVPTHHDHHYHRDHDYPSL